MTGKKICILKFAQIAERDLKNTAKLADETKIGNTEKANITAASFFSVLVCHVNTDGFEHGEMAALIRHLCTFWHIPTGRNRQL